MLIVLLLPGILDGQYLFDCIEVVVFVSLVVPW
nr:MAG TPA: Sigma factor-binding transcriptional regulator Crl [Caudoviricetes sp.]